MPATKTKKKRKLLNLLHPTARGALSLGDIRRMAKDNPQDFAEKSVEAIEDGALSVESIRDWPGLQQALIGIETPCMIDRRSINTGAFPMLTGNLSIAAINAAYEAVPTIGQELVREMDSNKDIQIVANIHALGHSMKRVEEGADYPIVGAKEEWVSIDSQPNGLRTIITQKLIDQNDTAGIVERLTAPGEIAAEFIEEQTLRRVTDADGSNTTAQVAPFVYNPLGKGVRLYDPTADNPGPRASQGTQEQNNALADDSNLERARTKLTQMLNERKKRIQIWRNDGSMILLVPDALVLAADKILRSEFTPGVFNELAPFGPRGRYTPNLLTSPKLDDLSTTTWYMGDFKRQFTRKWSLRMELVTLAMDEQAFLKSRIAFQSRIAWDVEIGATDYIFVVQNLDGTAYTPPAA